MRAALQRTGGSELADPGTSRTSRNGRKWEIAVRQLPNEKYQKPPFNRPSNALRRILGSLSL
jgi:hypothetical protein